MRCRNRCKANGNNVCKCCCVVAVLELDLFLLSLFKDLKSDFMNIILGLLLSFVAALLMHMFYFSQHCTLNSTICRMFLKIHYLLNEVYYFIKIIFFCNSKQIPCTNFFNCYSLAGRMVGKEVTLISWPLGYSTAPKGNNPKHDGLCEVTIIHHNERVYV